MFKNKERHTALIPRYAMTKWQTTAKRLLRTRLAPASVSPVVLLLAATVLAACSNKDASPSEQPYPPHNDSGRPNIVLFLLDDAGYSDMSAFGGEIQTPNIEHIVTEGMTVRRFYTTARCSPTRAGILTGLHPHDVGMADLAGEKFKTEFSAYQGRLPPAIPMISELLQAAGYRTYMQGKWHLGEVAGSQPDIESDAPPNQRGFDHFFGFLRGQAAPYPIAGKHPYQHNGETLSVDDGWYSIAELNRVTMKQLDRQFRDEPDTPFFLYIPSQAPHYPLQAPETLIEKYREIYAQPLEDIWNQRVLHMRELGLFPQEAPVKFPTLTAKNEKAIRADAAIRAAMIETADAELGKLIQLLKDSGRLDNTLILVASDNGAASNTGQLTNAPFRGAKGNLYEGGLLSPLVARWPAGNIGAGTRTDAMTTYLDIMPTFLQAADVAYPETDWEGAPLQPLSGRSLLPLFRGATLAPPEFFYWNLYGQFVVLQEGRWKLLGNRNYNEERERAQKKPLLTVYDLLSDPAETQNLAAVEQAKASLLLTEYQKWAQEHGAVPFYQVLDAYRINRGSKTPKAKEL
ncbi:Arylsulfatase [Halioglobus japonicus]|nr:Arylsulfatase [Halioglobus japonicus]